METEPARDRAGWVDDPGLFAAWAGPALLPMSRLARRLAPSADPDDLVQDALSRAWQKRSQYDAARGTATTWLLAIVADQARASRRRGNRWLRVVDDSAEIPDVAVEDANADVDLERAIGQLADRQQLAVHLHYFVGLSVDETASVMDCTTGTVKSTLFDARRRLRVLLGDDDD
ncbi:MAG TPA: RNA polymerase sigma factor [Jatrophihabitantaceae bacterium]|nr:RNA polymerase sigma factor [Jatrophihabitantaceae bacterium]